MPTHIKNKTERECNKCGRKCFAQVNYPCVECGGIFCLIVIPLPGKRVSGVLVRDRIKHTSIFHEIHLMTGVFLSDMNFLNCGRWQLIRTPLRGWTVEKWKEQYGKLPRKGSKQMVIIELVSNG